MWEDELKEKMQKVVLHSLESVQDMFDNRKGCIELFGYDIMVDDEMNPWLIEVNSSPTMEYSTSITKCLVKEVMEDTVKVIVDYHFARKKSSVDTGGFELIHKSKQVVDKPMSSFGLNLCLQGTKIKY